MADRARILVVEDERLVGILLQRALQGRGHRVTLVGDGIAAEAALAGDTFDLLLVDQRLPGMSGVELLERVVAAGIVAPVIMVSGVTAEHEVLRALTAGAADYIRKPFSVREVLARVELHLRHAQRTG